MDPTPSDERRRLAGLDRAALGRYQLVRANQLLAAVLPTNRFYAAKLGGPTRTIASWEDWFALPYTTKAELEAAAGEGLDIGASTILTHALERYVYLHQTSGTRGRPLVVLDTPEDWRWWLDCWQYVLDAAEITAADRVLMAFSFGPFVGFWSATDAARARGCLVIPGGGMSSLARLELIRAKSPSVLFCTPSYALHLAQVAAGQQVETRRLSVKKIIVAGEPGGSIPAMRQRLETAWNAHVFDHAGATEVGPWGFGDSQGGGLWITESQFIAEFVALDEDRAAGEGELAELVMTNLGRVGFPAIRYRTGDLVRPTWTREGPCRFVFLEGGVLGRRDEMLVIRGVNIFPSALDDILRGFPEIDEYRIHVHRRGELDQLRIEIEDRLDRPQRVAERLQVRLGLSVDVQTVPLNSLPRFEGKGRRIVDERA